MRSYGRRDGPHASRAAFTEAVTGAALRSRPEVADEETSEDGFEPPGGERDGWGRTLPVPTADELRQSLARHHGNVAAVGREFGKERMQIHRWMKRLGIDPNEYR
jgi:transcriptional regulator with GAF, ATPase, and Fis domain